MKMVILEELSTKLGSGSDLAGEVENVERGETRVSSCNSASE